MSAKKIKWAAELKGVKEVSLIGAADLSYWQEKLEKEGHRPLEKDGQAQVLIIAADAKFMGLRFKELSVSILVAVPDAGAYEQQAYLVHAFNSRRFFAICERTLFATPYYFGNVDVSTVAPASVEVIDGTTTLFRAAMKIAGNAPSQRRPYRCADDGWEGPVFLPSRRQRVDGSQRFFFARLRGYTKTYPYLQEEDECVIQSRAEHPVLESLIASEFVPQGWIIRNDAEHTKSKTYKQSDQIAV